MGVQPKLDNLTKTEDKVSGTVDKAMLDAQRFLLNIDKKIKAKESDLECPVCFEVPSMGEPIYQCREGHLVCSQCEPKLSKRKVNDCPKCRIKYDNPLPRSRLAERDIEKLNKFYKERDKLLKTMF